MSDVVAGRVSVACAPRGSVKATQDSTAAVERAFLKLRKRAAKRLFFISSPSVRSISGSFGQNDHVLTVPWVLLAVILWRINVTRKRSLGR